MILIWPFVRTLGLRAASAGLGALMSPAWLTAIACAVAFGALTWWSDHQRDIGREEERAAFAKASAEAEAQALKAAVETVAQRQAQEERDAAELAAKEQQEKQVRDENPGDGVLWRSDDGWLRAKRTAKTGR